MTNPPPSLRGPAIEAEGLVRELRIAEKAPGVRGTLRALFRPDVRMRRVVDGLSFRIEAGERVALLGPNGAGKTTTLRMLVGLLHPTAGRVRVAGREPARREAEFLRRIMLVAGQRHQLLWELPAFETFEMHRVLYEIPSDVFATRKRDLVDLLGVGDVIKRPVRDLSLGERMRCELVAGLLHEPRVLFLDEPTIGLDFAAQSAFRTFLEAYHARTNATIVLTSHDASDIAFASRVLLVDAGRLAWDGPLETLVSSLRPLREITVTTTRELTDAERARLGPGVERERWQLGEKLKLRRPASELPRLLAAIANLPVADVGIVEARLDEVLATLYAHRAAVPEAS